MLDTPTLFVIGAFILLIALAFFLKFSVPSSRNRIVAFFTVAAIVWLVPTVLGEFVTGWATNDICYTYLGCNSGFFGYDAVEHFLFGIALLFLLLLASEKFPSFSLKSKSRTKTVLTLIAYVALVAVVWEMFECGWDQYRITILHETLFSFRLHIDQLAQSSNLDTMGDISFSLLGALLSSLVAEFLEPHILKSAKRN